MSANRQQRTEQLRSASARKSEEAQAKARRAIVSLENTGRPVNFNTVAAAAGVSKNFLYENSEIRRRIVDLRRAPVRRTESSPAAARSHEASTAVKLSVAVAALQGLRKENQQLRDENARLQGELLAERRRSRIGALSAGPRSVDTIR